MGEPKYIIEEVDFGEDTAADPEWQTLVGSKPGIPEDVSEILEPAPDDSATPAEPSFLSYEPPAEAAPDPEPAAPTQEIPQHMRGQMGFPGLDRTNPDPIGQSAVDTAIGVGEGVTSRWGAEGAAAGTPEAKDPLMALAKGFGGEGQDTTGIPREYAAGSAYADLRNTNQQRINDARERSPILTNFVGEPLGGVAQFVATRGIGTELAALGKGKAALDAANALRLTNNAANVARATPIVAGAAKARDASLNLAGQGYAIGTGGSESHDPATVMKDGLETATLMGVLGGGGSAVLQGVGSGAQAAAPYLKKMAHWTRGKAMGAPDKLGSAADAIGRVPGVGGQSGEHAATAVGRKAEEMGLPGYKKGPMTSADYTDALEARALDAGEAEGIVVDRASERGAEVPTTEILDKLMILARRHADTPGKQAKNKAREVRDTILELVRGGKSKQSARDLLDMKKAYEKEGGFIKGESPQAPERVAYTKQAKKDIAGVARRSLNGLFDPRNAPDAPVASGSVDDAIELYNPANSGAPAAGSAIQLRNPDASGVLLDDMNRFNEARQTVQAARAMQGYTKGAEGNSGITRVFGRAMEKHMPFGHVMKDAIDGGTDLAAMGLNGLSALAKRGGALTGETAANTNNQTVAAGLRAITGGNQGASPFPVAAQSHGQKGAALAPAMQAEVKQRAVEAEQAAGLPSMDAPQQSNEDIVRTALQHNPQAFGKFSAQLLNAASDPRALTAELYKLQDDPEFRAQFIGQ